jgi:hypothetical protein
MRNNTDVLTRTATKTNLTETPEPSKKHRTMQKAAPKKSKKGKEPARSEPESL